MFFTTSRAGVHETRELLWERMHDTVAEKTVNIPSTSAILKPDQFDRAKPILQMLLVSWTETLSTEEV